MRFEGAFTALVTPFRDGSVDEKALAALVEAQIEGGIDGLVPCGTTGESVSLDADEHERVVAVVAQAAAGRVPVVAGASTNSTRKSIELARRSKSAGADGLLLVCPYYNRPTQAGLEAHVRTILDAVPLPGMLYNVPARCAVDMEVDTIARLAQHELVVALKEASGNILKAQDVVAACGDRLTVLSGDDVLTVGMAAVGGRGVVSVLSNLCPGPVSKVAAACLDGDFARARAQQQKLLPAIRAMFVETNPGPIKAVLAARGLIGPEMRLPMVAPSAEVLAAVCATLEAQGL
jgi:4-hydroxy-tetrahydrodipicolinate synthase